MLYITVVLLSPECESKLIYLGYDELLVLNVCLHLVVVVFVVV